jgi:hypothetical protein
VGYFGLCGTISGGNGETTMTAGVLIEIPSKRLPNTSEKSCCLTHFARWVHGPELME